jgi:hypothetical protein
MIYLIDSFVGYIKYYIMSKFPLYASLSVNLPNKDLTAAQKADIVKQISALDQDGQNLVYALIKSYFLDKDTGDVLAIPYQGVFNQGRLKFDLANFPIPLRQILFKFVSMHNRKMREDLLAQPLTDAVKMAVKSNN